MNIISNVSNVIQIKLLISPINVLVLKKPIYLEIEIVSLVIILVLIVKDQMITNAPSVIKKKIGDKWPINKDTIVFALISRLIMMI
jgi:hypothetical protein